MANLQAVLSTLLHSSSIQATLEFVKDGERKSTREWPSKDGRRQCEDDNLVEANSTALAVPCKGDLVISYSKPDLSLRVQVGHTWLLLERSSLQDKRHQMDEK